MTVQYVEHSRPRVCSHPLDATDKPEGQGPVRVSRLGTWLPRWLSPIFCWATGGWFFAPLPIWHRWGGHVGALWLAFLAAWP